MCVIVRYSMVLTEQYSIVCYSTLQYCNTLWQYSAVEYGTVQYSMLQYSTVWYRMLQYSTVGYCTVLYVIVRYHTVQYGTLHYCTVLYSKVKVTLMLNIIVLLYYLTRPGSLVPTRAIHRLLKSTSDNDSSSDSNSLHSVVVVEYSKVLYNIG